MTRCKSDSLRAAAAIFCLALLAGIAGGAEWYVAVDGTPDGKGTLASPWDLESTLAGRQPVAPGDTVWIDGGKYKHPNRSLGSPGYVVRLAGEEGKPTCVRGTPGQRVTIDGGLSVQEPSTRLWVRDLEILVSENFTMSRRVEEPGSHPKSYNRPWGGLSIHAGEGSKFINLVIHDNAQGISWWRGSTDSEVHGCIIYDNGWDAPDRGHGHAVYTQNQDGLKIISDCIMTGGYSYTMHAYGSSRAYVDNYLVEGNVCCDGGTFLVGGGRPSRNIRVEGNYLFGVNMQIGYSAPYNEDCRIRDNVIVGGSLNIKNYRRVEKEGNLVLKKGELPPDDTKTRIVLRPNRYDPDRANLAIYNWRQARRVEVPLSEFLGKGDRYRLVRPRHFYGKPVLTGTFDGKAVSLPLEGPFGVFVLLRERPD